MVGDCQTWVLQTFEIVRKMNTINDDEPSNDAYSPPMSSSRSDVAYGTRQATGATGCENNCSIAPQVLYMPTIHRSKILSGTGDDFKVCCWREG